MAERNYDLTKGGVKYDNDKLEWSLIPMLECLEGVVRVLMYGAKKYTRDNWKAGMPWTRVSDAAKRHLFAWDALEDLDAETSLNHIDHALCELLFLRYYIRKGVGEDDRFKRTDKAKKQAELRKALEEKLKDLLSVPQQPPMPVNQRDCISFPPLYKKIGEDIPHEDAEGDPNYWGV